MKTTNIITPCCHNTTFITKDLQRQLRRFHGALCICPFCNCSLTVKLNVEDDTITIDKGGKVKEV